VRRPACDAGIIPAVLGGEGEVLDLGRTRRLITPALRLATWLRDRRCTYPGCTIPCQWCDGHHGVSWQHGGATDLRNITMLCPRPHTIVHERGLRCTITPTEVTW